MPASEPIDTALCRHVNPRPRDFGDHLVAVHAAAIRGCKDGLFDFHGHLALSIAPIFSSLRNNPFQRFNHAARLDVQRDPHLSATRVSQHARTSRDASCKEGMA